MRLAIILAGFAAVAGTCMAAAPKLTVQITNANDYCFILPSTRKTIGDSEDGGDGAKSFCTKPKQGQGQLPTGADAWKHGPNYLKKKTYVQITGCINTRKYKTLIPSDGGGQYDSDGGIGGLGNPRSSVCTGYKSYVEVVEPDTGRICIRCCNDNKYCPLQYDTQGCAAVVRNGDYSGC